MYPGVWKPRLVDPSKRSLVVLFKALPFGSIMGRFLGSSPVNTYFYFIFDDVEMNHTRANIKQCVP